VSNSLLTLFGAAAGTVIVALIAYFGGRGKSAEETRALYVSASDVVVENLREEVGRLADEVRSLHAEIGLLHAMIRQLGGDPRDLPNVRYRRDGSPE
jgi:hypothetical protein